MKARRPVLTQLFALAIVLGLGACAHAEDDVKTVESEHFVVFYSKSDVENGLITEADAQFAANTFEKVYKRYVGDQGLRTPVVKPPSSAYAGKTEIMIYDFTGTKLAPSPSTFTETTGNTNIKDAAIDLPLHRWGGGHREPEMVLTAAHELFHAIQGSYVPAFGDDKELHDRYEWLLDATANWAAREAFPDLAPDWHLDDMQEFLAGPHRAINDDTDGRRYGTMVFFRFLGKHYGGTKLLARLMDELQKEVERKQSAKDYDPLAVVRAALDVHSDAEFRDIYDRFAAACALGTAAPAEKQLADKVGPTRSLLSEPWLRLLGPFPPPPEDMIESGLRGLTVLGYGGARSYRVRGVPDERKRMGPLPADAVSTYSTLHIEVKSVRDELSVQVFVSKTPGKPERLERKAAFNAADGRYLLHVPNFDQLAEVLVVVTRYGKESASDAFPVYFTVATPPIVKSVKVTQGSNTKYHVEWKDQSDKDGVVTARTRQLHVESPLDGSRGDARVELVFSTPVSSLPGGVDLLTFDKEGLDGGMHDGGVTWRYTIPARKLKGTKHELRVRANGVPGNLPLDTNPATVAMPLGGKWENYERDPAEMVLSLGGVSAESPVVKLSMVQFPGSEWEYVRVQCSAFADLRAHKMKGAFSGTIAVSTSSKGPFDRPAGMFRLLESTKTEVGPDQPGDGWVGPDTYQVQAAPWMTRDRHDDDGPVYYQVTVEPLDRTATGPDPVWKSNIVAPEAPAIRVLTAMRDSKVVLRGNDGDGINAGHPDYSWGTLRLKLSPKNQQYGYPHVRFVVTINGTTRYLFSQSNSGTQSGRNEATLEIPAQTDPVQYIDVRAEWGGKVFKNARFAVLQNDAGWARLQKWREAGKTLIENDTKSWQGLQDRELRLCEKRLADVRKALEELRRSSKPSPVKLANLTRFVEKVGPLDLARARIGVKKPKQDHDVRMGTTLNDHALLVEAYKLQLQILQEEHEIDSQRGNAKVEDSYQNSQLYYHQSVADAALRAGNTGVFRDALENRVIPLQSELLAAGKLGRLGIAPNKAELLAQSCEHLADGLVALTGETADAKRFWLNAYDARWQNADDKGKKHLEAEWASGKRPAWWPGD